MLEFKFKGWAGVNWRRTKGLSSILKRLMGSSEDRRLVGDDSLATNDETQLLKADGYLGLYSYRTGKPFKGLL